MTATTTTARPLRRAARLLAAARQGAAQYLRGPTEKRLARLYRTAAGYAEALTDLVEAADTDADAGKGGES
jgi:hypothetical protein